MSASSVSQRTLNSSPLVERHEFEPKTKQSNSLSASTTCQTDIEMQKFHNAPATTEPSHTTMHDNESARPTTPSIRSALREKQNRSILDLPLFQKN